jgi:hypothetical protein
MKTLKFALVAAIVACTMVSLAYAGEFKEKPKPIKVVNVSLAKAVHIPGLVCAMYQQLDPKDFLDNLQAIYVAEVKLNNTIYRITGTRSQWIKFFQMEDLSPANTKEKVFTTN